jgi:signal transduction histidine kinase
VVEVIDARGRVLARSLTLGARVLPLDAVARAAVSRGRAGFEDVVVDDHPYRLYDAPIAAGLGGPASGGAVLVASDTSDISRTLGRLGLVVALAGVAVAALAVLGAVWLTRRGLAPLQRLAAAAGEIERTADPARRLPRSVVPDEIGQLTGVLNRMLTSLEASRESERRFLADASHELRTPVTALIGNVEFVARHGADTEVLEDLRRDAARLGRLVDDLLAMERSGRAGPESSLSSVDVDAVVREAVAGMQGLNGRLEVGPVEPAQVIGERDALARVVENLVSNAVVHGPASGKVSVALREVDGHAVLSVRDEGPGPDPVNAERLFERFWRAPEAAERPGSGLGLAIVAAIVNRHGGRVSVDGSTFKVELPVVPGADRR